MRKPSWGKWLMVAVALAPLSLALQDYGDRSARAQESEGGSIGGSISAAAPARQGASHASHARHEPAPRRTEVVRTRVQKVYVTKIVREAPARRPAAEPTGGGVERFNGTWYTATSGPCGTSSGQIQVFGGRLTGQYARGTVSPNGDVHSFGAGNGLTSVSNGHLSATTGHGTFHRSDGCVGSWSASKS